MHSLIAMQYEKGEFHMDWQMNKLVMKELKKNIHMNMCYLFYMIYFAGKKKKSFTILLISVKKRSKPESSKSLVGNILSLEMQFK